MKALRISLFSLLASLLIIACVNPPDYPDAPVIEYIGVNKTTVFQGSANLPADTLAIFFSFTDGDGDLSSEDSTDVYLYDSRFPEILNPYKIPLIPDEGTGNGIRGEISVRIQNANNICCIENGFACPPNPTIEIDTFSYEIQIRDRSGNFSNRIRTETIGILCQQ